MRKPIKHPVLAIGVLDNPLVDSDLVQLSKKYVKSGFTYHEFEFGGHHLHERNPEQLLPVLTKWLTQVYNS
jgi:predicted alpha/beta-fold hydrolase